MFVRRLLLAVGLFLVCADTVRAQPQLAVNGATPPAVASATAGGTVSVTVSGGPGHVDDWVALFVVGAPDNTYLDLGFLYLNGSSTVAPSIGLTDATITFAVPGEAGDYEFRFFANNSYQRLATTVFSVAPSIAHLTVNGVAPPTVVAASAGTHVAVNVVDGPANATDRLGLYAIDAPNDEPIEWNYLSGTRTAAASGTAAASLNFAVPTSAGSYEFRFFAHNLRFRLATSTTVAVEASQAQLAVNGTAPPAPVSVVAGSLAIVSISGGPANTTDWVGLYASGAVDSEHLDWWALTGSTTAPPEGLSAATIQKVMPTIPGTYEFRFFAENTYGRLATSSTITVYAPTAEIAVNGLTPPAEVHVSPGATVAVHVTKTPGSPHDWISLAEAGAPNSSYLAWQYLSGSTTAPGEAVTDVTLNVTMPAASGAYEFRLFANNGVTRLATSSTVRPLTVSSPTTSLLAGTYYEELGVVVSTPTVGATIRYTLDGQVPTESAQVIASGGTLGIDRSVVLKLKAFRNGLPPSDIVTVDYVLQVPAPLLTPAPGHYTAPQEVVIVLAPNGLFHYTVNGAEPTEADAAVPIGGAVLLEATLTLRVKGWREGWMPSSTSSATYTLDLGPDVTSPTITAAVLPSPRANGWTNARPTVSFTCTDSGSGVSSCSEPVTVVADGAGQMLIGTATDAAGNTTTTPVTLNVDSASPEVTLTAPATETTATTISLTGTVSDLLSGLASATCNGTPAVLDGGNFTCNVALSRGGNSVVIHAADAAGNSASAGARVVRTEPRTALQITPSSRTILVGDAWTVRVVDQIGVSVGDATWQSSAEQVASIAVLDGLYVLTGHTAGQATLTASVGGLTAELTVTVMGGSSLPLGTAKWSFTHEWGTANNLSAHRLDVLGPEQFVLGYDGANYVVRALSADGEQLWTESLDLYSAFNLAFADTFGGVVLPVRDSTVGYQGISLIRRGGATGGAPWEYRPAGMFSLDDKVAQGPDGTIYLLEYGESHPQYPHISGVRSMSLVTLDGRTGLTKSRTPLPQNTCGNIQVVPWSHTSPFVGIDGAAYVAVGNQPYRCSDDEAAIDSTVQLLRVDGSGAASLHVMRTYGPLDRFRVLPNVADLKPDGQGGMLLSGQDQIYNAETTFDEFRDWVLRFSEGGVGEWPGNPHVGEFSLVGREDTVYTWGADGFTARDPASGAANWSTVLEDYETPIQVLPEGGALLYNSATGSATPVDRFGVRGESDAFPVFWYQPFRTGIDEWSGTVDGATVKVTTRAFVDRTVVPNPYGQNAALPKRGLGIFAKGHSVAFIAPANHSSLRLVPSDQDLWRQQRSLVFTKTDEFGNYFATIGAGPVPTGCGGTMVSELNRTSDVTQRPTALELLQYSPVAENELIERLLHLESRYPDDLTYECFPDPGTDEYNSNSFISGLLDAADIGHPRFPYDQAWLYPGWTKPVPRAKFGIEP